MKLKEVKLGVWNEKDGVDKLAAILRDNSASTKRIGIVDDNTGKTFELYSIEASKTEIILHLK